MGARVAFPAPVHFLVERRLSLGLLGGLAVRRIPEIGQEGDPRFARIA